MRTLIAALGAVFLIAGIGTSALAQTGKIAGQVTDAETGEPLPGVNVIVEGEQMGATTNQNGQYTILNVAPGTYTLRASFVGYADQVVQGVEVNIDLTATQNFQLQEETQQLQEVTVQAEERIIRPDISGSEVNINPVNVQAAQYQSISDVITSQVSVASIDAYEDEPQLRGEDMTRSKIIVDGYSQGNPLTNRPLYQVNLEAIQDMKIQTGGFSAEYGDLRSGIINVATKTGGTSYSGSIDFQYSPPALKHFGPMMTGHDSPIAEQMVSSEPGALEGKAFTGENNIFFEGWNAVANERLNPGEPHYGKPAEVYARWLWRHRSTESIDELLRLKRNGVVDIEFAKENPYDYVLQQYGTLPDLRGSATLGGPVPLTNQEVRFFASYNSRFTEYVYRAGIPGYKNHNGRLRLTSTPVSSIKLNAVGSWSWGRGTSGTGGRLTDKLSSSPYGVALGRGVWDTRKVWYPDCMEPRTKLHQTYGIDMTHTVSPETFYEVRLSHSRVDQDQSVQVRNTAPIPGSEGNWPIDHPVTTSGGPSGVTGGLIGTAERADSLAQAGQQGWNNWRDWAKIRIGDHWYDEAPRGHGPINWKDITNRYPLETCFMTFDNTYTRSFEVEADLASQVTPHHLLKTGFMVNWTRIHQEYNGIGPATGRRNERFFDADPWKGALYLQDKIEYQGMVANLGLRLDALYTGAYPMLNYDEQENTQSGPYSDVLLAGNAADEEGNMLLAEKLGEQRVLHARLSPRLGISHPITEVAKIYFNYGHRYQWPDANTMYDIQYTFQGNLIQSYGNPRIKPPKTIAYELGYEHNLYDALNGQVTLYYKDVRNGIANVWYNPIDRPNYPVPANATFADVRGLETQIRLRRGVIPFISGFANVNYMVRSGGRFGNVQFFEDPTRQPARVSEEVSAADIRPTVRLSIDFHTPQSFGPEVLGQHPLGGASLNFLGYWKRGPSFTWNPAGFPNIENNVRWRAERRVDMRFRKTLFRIGDTESIFYIDVINLFNHKNMTRPSESWNGNQGGRWAWDLHDWWDDQFLDYMQSLGYTDDNMNEDGSFETDREPGDYKGDVDLPAFTPLTFLEKRDVFFGLKLRF